MYAIYRVNPGDTQEELLHIHADHRTLLDKCSEYNATARALGSNNEYVVTDWLPEQRNMERYQIAHALLALASQSEESAFIPAACGSVHATTEEDTFIVQNTEGRCYVVSVRNVAGL